MKAVGSGVWLRAIGLAIGLAAGLMLAGGDSAYAQIPGVEHVVVIGVDGLSPDGIRKAETPHLHRLMKAGASTLHARGVMPTVSSPNWASMIMGAGPEQHGVTSNDWEPGKSAITPTAVGSGGIFPTIFGLLREPSGRRQDRPASTTGTASAGCSSATRRHRSSIPKGPARPRSGPSPISRRNSPSSLSSISTTSTTPATSHGHGTPEYYQAVAEADRLIGLVLEGLDDAGIAGKRSCWSRPTMAARARGTAARPWARSRSPGSSMVPASPPARSSRPRSTPTTRRRPSPISSGLNPPGAGSPARRRGIRRPLPPLRPTGSRAEIHLIRTIRFKGKNTIDEVPLDSGVESIPGS